MKLLWIMVFRKKSNNFSTISEVDQPHHIRNTVRTADEKYARGVQAGGCKGHEYSGGGVQKVGDCVFDRMPGFIEQRELLCVLYVGHART
jgi:hypothetical protein